MINYLKSNFLNIIQFILALILSAINFNLLLKPINLVAGGASGLSLALSNIINISISNFVIIIYIITFLLSLFFLDNKTVRSIILASILYPLFTYLTEDITNIITLNYSDVFLVCISSGIISGITNGLAFKFGYAPGGLGVLAPIFSNLFKISVSTVNFIVNTIVVLLGAYYYGFNMVIYAIVLLYISSYVCNLVILGLAGNKVIFIKSRYNNRIIELLHEKYSITATILDDESNTEILMAVVKNIDYNPLKIDLLKIDKKVLFTTNDCYEVGR